MTIHVNIGEAKARLSELIAASERGEEVIIARAGKPAVKLVPANETLSVSEIRRRAFGSLKLRGGEEVDWLAPAYSEEEWDQILSEDDHLFDPGDDEAK